MKLAILTLLALAFPAVGFCVTPYDLPYRPSKYVVTHSTVAISSVTASVIAPQTQGNWLDTEISSSTGRYFYRRDGLTANVTSYGIPVTVGNSLNVQGFGAVSIQLMPGHAAQELRITTIEPVK